MLTRFSTVVRRVIARLRRDRLEDELREEIEGHIELRRQQLIEDGADPSRAGQDARRAFGNVTRVREHAREMWTLSALDALGQDLRYGLRMIAKGPGFSAVAVVSLAVGIGSATVLFSFANAWLFRPLPVADPEHLVEVFTGSSGGAPRGGSSYPDFEDFRGSGVFAGLAASMRVRATLTDAERADMFHGLLVSGDYFDVLGLRPFRGRFFQKDESPDADPVVVLSHDAWQRRYGGDNSVIGSTIRINARPFTLIGIGPPRFSGPGFDHAAEFFVPVMMLGAIGSGDSDVLRDRRSRAFTLLGRLADGVTVTEADAALRVLSAQLFRQYPVEWANRAGRARSVTIMRELDARARPGEAMGVLGAMIAAVVLLVGIACVNVATVLLARAATRRKEMALRLALGASRPRVVRQLLTECALLAVAGGALGLLLAQTSAALFARFRPNEAPAFDLTVDYRVALFSAATSMLAVLFFGLAPALQTTRADVTREMKDREPVVRTRRFRFGLRDVLVVVQIATSLVLVLGAALMVRSLRAVGTEDLGFRRYGIVNVAVDLSTSASRGPDLSEAFVRDALRAVKGLPGVQTAAFAGLVPLDGSTRHHGIEVQLAGRTVTESVDVNSVSSGYFRMLELPLVQGREFGDVDRAGSPPVAVINEAMAARFWGTSALGSTFRDPDTGDTIEVVGIVRDFRHRFFTESPRPMAWFPVSQQPVQRGTLHIVTQEAPAAIGPALRDVLRTLEPAMGLQGPATMQDYVEFVTLPQRISGGAAAALGLLELGLAAMALYGVIAFTVARRTREIGIRVALGASSRSVARMIMRDGLVLAVSGIVLGVLASFAAAPAFASLLIGIGPADPVSVGVAAVVILLVAATASYVPARRALRVDPSVALRTE